MEYFYSVYKWIVTEEEIKFVGILEKIARELNCVLVPQRKQEPQSGFEMVTFTVYSLSETTLNNYIEHVSSATPFVNWIVGLEKTYLEQQSGMENWDWMQAHPFLDTLFTLAQYNTSLRSN